jgi:menaquinone-9 beta-reductase
VDLNEGQLRLSFLTETTPQRLPALSYFHPEMQQTLLAQAERAGVEIRRGVNVTGIRPGAHPSLTATSNGGPVEHIFARLIVAADGRGSAARKWAAFSTQKDAEPYYFAGVLLEGLTVPRDLCTFVFNPDVGLMGGMVPQSANRSRMYLGYSTHENFSLRGSEKLDTFLKQARNVAPVFADCSAQARALGPVAAFDGGFFWVDRPYRDGVALIGDAAGTSDPTFGQGMSLTLRDARVLRDALLSDSDWDLAGKLYAEQHNAYFSRIRTVCGWTRSLFQEQGPDADARRQRAMPKIAEDLTRVPDHLFSGPEMPLDDSVRSRFFGEC